MLDPERDERRHADASQAQQREHCLVSQLARGRRGHHSQRVFGLPDAGRRAGGGSSGFGLVAAGEAEIVRIHGSYPAAKTVLLGQPKDELA
jgi:hypothetical protein